ncbi:MAG: hypothetical protein Q9223_005775 [Gallowayella weberi]
MDDLKSRERSPSQYAAPEYRAEPIMTFFRLMDLPMEIRRIIYGFALDLPREDVLPLTSKAWVPAYDPHGNDNPCMNLLVTNKLVSNEARETWIIYFLAGSTRPDRFEAFPISPSMKYIKHWQFDIHREKRYIEDDRYIKDTILGVSEELVGINDLQTLKVKFPCVCGVVHASIPGESFLPKDFEDIRCFFQSLKRLRFKGNVTFIAARRFAVEDEYDWIEPEGPLENCTVPSQCQQPACLKYVSHLDDLKEHMTSSAPSEGLLEQQLQWLEVKESVKKRAMLFHRHPLIHADVVRNLKRLLDAVIRALRFAEDEVDSAEEIEYERKAYQMVYDKTQERLKKGEENAKRQEAFRDELRAQGLSTWDGLPREETEFCQE